MVFKKLYRCKKCGHTWERKSLGEPVVCPACKRYDRLTHCIESFMVEIPEQSSFDAKSLQMDGVMRAVCSKCGAETSAWMNGLSIKTDLGDGAPLTASFPKMCMVCFGPYYFKAVAFQLKGKEQAVESRKIIEESLAKAGWTPEQIRQYFEAGQTVTEPTPEEKEEFRRVQAIAESELPVRSEE